LTNGKPNNGEYDSDQLGSNPTLRRSEGEEQQEIRRNPTEQFQEGNKEPLPRDVELFIADVRELFREIKKFTIFFRNKGNSNGALVAATIMLVVVGFFQLLIIGLELSPIRKSADSSARQLEMLDRPWLKEELTSASDFRSQKGGAMDLAVTIKVDNVGHSVATDVSPDGRLIAIKDADFIDGPRRQVTELCKKMSERWENVKTTDPSIWNNSIFPDDSHTFIPLDVFLWPKDIDSNSLDGGAQLGKSIFPVFIGCIEYHFPTSSRPHHTGFVYFLTHTDIPSLPDPTRAFFSVSTTVPKDNIVLTKSAQVAD
jgi:hypothetical protein